MKDDLSRNATLYFGNRELFNGSFHLMISVTTPFTSRAINEYNGFIELSGVKMDDRLKKRVGILLSNVNVRTPHKTLNYMHRDEEGRAYGVEADELIDDSPGSWQLNNTHTETLIKLSQQLSSAEIKDLHQSLLAYLQGNTSEQIVDVVTLYFVHTNRVDELFEYIKANLTTYNKGALLQSIHCLSEAMRHRADLFSEASTENIYDWCRDYMTSKSKLGRDADEYTSLYRGTTEAIRHIQSKANEILTRNFEKQIDNAFNPELNTDEQRVIEEIDAIGLPLDLSESMKHINELITQANTPMKYRDAMSAIRAYTERFYEQVAKVLDKDTKIDGKDSEAVAKYFKSQKLLSQDMADLLVAHRHFLSNDGTHRIKSRREDARIAKNLTIELSLYILTRLRELRAK